METTVFQLKILCVSCFVFVFHPVSKKRSKALLPFIWQTQETKRKFISNRYQVLSEIKWLGFLLTLYKKTCVKLLYIKKAKGLRTRLLERERETETEGERRHCLQTIF